MKTDAKNNKVAIRCNGQWLILKTLQEWSASFFSLLQSWRSWGNVNDYSLFPWKDVNGYKDWEFDYEFRMVSVLKVIFNIFLATSQLLETGNLHQTMFSYILTLFWTRNCKSPTQISNTSICFLANNTLFCIMHVYHISHNFIIISCSSVRNENKPTLDQECQVCLPDLLNQNLCPDESKRKKIHSTSTIHSSKQYCRYMH